MKTSEPLAAKNEKKLLNFDSKIDQITSINENKTSCSKFISNACKFTQKGNYCIVKKENRTFKKW